MWKTIIFYFGVLHPLHAGNSAKGWTQIFFRESDFAKGWTQIIFGESDFAKGWVQIFYRKSDFAKGGTNQIAD